MLVSRMDRKLSQEEIVDASGARKTVMKVGIPLIDLAMGLRKLYPDLTVWGKTEATIEDVQRLLAEDYAVAVDWQGIFTADEYGDDEEDKWGNFWDRITRAPALKGTQGHYCVALEVNTTKGYLRFADPYGHYAGKDRFVALWEFEERWWDDRIGVNDKGKKVYILENRLMFLVTRKGDGLPKEMGMMEI
jgi:hypothetical protein